MAFSEDIDAVLAELRTMLVQKNIGYGNSALEPVRIFSKRDNIEQIRVRIDDKLSRIMRGNGTIKEDTVFDLMGYLVLLRVADKQKTQDGALKTKSWDELNPMMQAPGSKVPGSAIVPKTKENPNPFTSDTSDSTFPRINSAMTGDVKPERPTIETNSQSKIETKLSPSLPAFKFVEIAAFEVSCQPTTKGKAIYWLHPGGKKIKISRENYAIMIYADISDLVYLYDHPMEAPLIIQNYAKKTYENKAVVLRGFLRDVPLSALTEKKDAPVPAKKEEPKGQEDGCCDDIIFESCANNKPENCKFCVDESRFEDKKKLDAAKPGAPLLKASMGV